MTPGVAACRGSRIAKTGPEGLQGDVFATVLVAVHNIAVQHPFPID